VRRETLMAALARHAPHLELRGLAAGFNVTVLLPEGVEENEVVTGARERSVGVYGLSDNSIGDGAWPPALVLGFGNVGEGAIEKGIASIADLLNRR
jgi:GntR family transcriptional regulator/MocR family aminotransferase